MSVEKFQKHEHDGGNHPSWAGNQRDLERSQAELDEWQWQPWIHAMIEVAGDSWDQQLQELRDQGYLDGR